MEHKDLTLDKILTKQENENIQWEMEEPRKRQWIPLIGAFIANRDEAYGKKSIFKDVSKFKRIVAKTYHGTCMGLVGYSLGQGVNNLLY
ncbi:MAG: hypothetical protein ABIH25_03770 [Candidatus Woesearchaeota archaeon]